MIWVKKRSGELVEFNKVKIRNAILSAVDSIEHKQEHTIHQINNIVTEVISLSNIDNNTVYTIENIQDSVEIVLMKKLPDVAKAYILYRKKRADLRLSRLKPDSNAIADYIFLSKYSKFIHNLNKRERHTDITIKRVEDMHINRFPEFTDIIKQHFKKVYDKKVQPSMRSMQFGGEAINGKNGKHGRLFNCSGTLIDRPNVFKGILYLLLCGCGVGYSVQWRHIEKLPKLQLINKYKVIHHIIEDSIEGWSNAIDNLMTAYFYTGDYIEFSYAKIRKEGSTLYTSGGKAPGHLGLKSSIEEIRTILNNAEGRSLRPIECHDICCFLAMAVLSGGVRRSAMLSLFSVNDTEMMYCKTKGNYDYTINLNTQRAYANNSALLIRNTVKKKYFSRIMKIAFENYGEPGFYFANSKDIIPNPCFTGNMRLLTDKGYKTFESLDNKEIIILNKYQNKVKSKVWYSGEKHVIQLNFQDKKPMRCTPDHIFLTVDNREIKAKNLKGMYLASPYYINPNYTKVISIDNIGLRPVYDFTESITSWGIVENVIVHNCGEISLNPVLEKENGEKETGFSMCNLSEINGAVLKTPKEFYEACESAAFIGTLQATYTDFSFLNDVTEEIIKRDALIGVSITGIMDNPKICLNPKILQKGVKVIKKTNEKYSKIFGINKAKRLVTIKPSGTSSLYLGCIGSGIHPHHAKRYFRRIIANKNEPPLIHFEKINPHMVETKPDGLKIITFCVEAPINAIIDISALNMLKNVYLVYDNWIKLGVADGETMCHNISCTLTIKDSERLEVLENIWENKNSIGSMSFAEANLDKIYKDAPRERILTEEDEIKWNKILKGYKVVNWDDMIEIEDNTTHTLEPTCAGGACEL